MASAVTPRARATPGPLIFTLVWSLCRSRTRCRSRARRESDRAGQVLVATTALDLDIGARTPAARPFAARPPTARTPAARKLGHRHSEARTPTLGRPPLARSPLARQRVRSARHTPAGVRVLAPRPPARQRVSTRTHGRTRMHTRTRPRACGLSRSTSSSVSSAIRSRTIPFISHCISCVSLYLAPNREIRAKQLLFLVFSFAVSSPSCVFSPQISRIHHDPPRIIAYSPRISRIHRESCVNHCGTCNGPPCNGVEHYMSRNGPVMVL